MAKFAGTWKYVSRHNNEKILDIFGTPAEMQKKILDGMKAVNTESTWDEKTATLSVSNTMAGMKNEVKMKMNETFPVGPHAPGFTYTIYELGDDLIRAKVKTPEGEEIGTTESRVDGKKFYTTTKLKGETGTMELEKVE